MKFISFSPITVLVAIFAFCAFAIGQESPQAAVASKTAKFDAIAKTDDLYKTSIDSHDLAGAEKLFSERGSFKGTVTKVFVPKSGTILILNFDADYKKALTAILKKADFKAFPDMNQLLGKEIVVSGMFTKFNGTLQIELIKPNSISLVK